MSRRLPPILECPLLLQPFPWTSEEYGRPESAWKFQAREIKCEGRAYLPGPMSLLDFAFGLPSLLLDLVEPLSELGDFSADLVAQFPEEIDLSGTFSGRSRRTLRTALASRSLCAA